MDTQHHIATAARRTVVIAALAVSHATAHAQASPGKFLLGDALTAVSQVSVEILPDTIVPLPQLATHLLPFATGVRTAYSSETHGAWSYSGDTATWTLSIAHQGARSLNLRLTDIHWPAGTEMRLYDRAGTLAQGPYRPGDVSAGELWTALVEGDRLVLELTTPASTALQASMRISQVNIAQSTAQKSQATGCDISTACPEADAWTQDATQATAMITVGGRIQCTATLLNNTRRDRDPLMLTARHCGIGSSPDMSATSVVVYWNHQASRCDNGDNGTRRLNQSGAVLLATLPDTDGTLIRLNTRPPAAANATYAGWDSTGRASSRGATLHHPRGTDKKISLFDSTPGKGRARVDDWIVESWNVTWSEGVTAPGSSGSGLWNSQHRLIGHLSGGRSQCGQSQGPDFYARLDADWNGRSNEALQPWLDPLGTGQRTLDALDGDSQTIAANADVFNEIPQDVDEIELDVLQNDSGIRPLTLTFARAQRGAVLIVGDRLVYRWSGDAMEDEIEYRIVDRMGHEDQTIAKVARSHPGGTGSGSALSEPSIGAGAATWLLGLGALGWRRRRRA